MTTIQDYQRLQAQVAALREQLMSERSAELLENPELAETLLQEVESQLQEWEKAEAEKPSPNDGGLAQLIGIGPDAINEFGLTRLSTGFEEYDDTVTAERLHAIADLYYIFQHEKLGIFRAVLKLRELFKAGTLRLSNGPGAFGLYQFDRKESLRYTNRDRLQAYRRVLGYTKVTPPPGSKPNVQFHGLLINFMDQVSQYFRDKRVSEVIRPHANAGTFGSIAVVRRAGLDLRNNLKTASYGHVNVLRVEVLQLLEESFRILGSEDIKKEYGADNAWDVIESVFERHLGRSQINASQRNRMAIAGRNVLRWLSYGHILKSNRTEFEGMLLQIADNVEEWRISAETLGIKPTSGKVIPSRNGRRKVPKRPRESEGEWGFG